MVVRKLQAVAVLAVVRAGCVRARQLSGRERHTHELERKTCA